MSACACVTGIFQIRIRFTIPHDKRYGLCCTQGSIHAHAVPRTVRSHQEGVCSIVLWSIRVRLHWSQNRHNTAKQHLSGYTLQESVATFKPAVVLSIATTFESYAHCSKYLA